MNLFDALYYYSLFQFYPFKEVFEFEFLYDDLKSKQDVQYRAILSKHVPTSLQG